MQPYIDARLPEDVRQVLDATEILKVREIDLFRLAWHAWHGSPGEDRVIETAFVAYMFHKRVPPWVRKFARDTLDRAARGKLQPQPRGIVRRRHEPPLLVPGGLYVAIVFAIAVIFVVMLTGTTYDPMTSAPMPCEAGEGLKALARLAFELAGSPPPDCLAP